MEKLDKELGDEPDETDDIPDFEHDKSRTASPAEKDEGMYKFGQFLFLILFVKGGIFFYFQCS